jgi:hypothetical protein
MLALVLSSVAFATLVSRVLPSLRFSTVTSVTVRLRARLTVFYRSPPISSAMARSDFSGLALTASASALCLLPVSRAVVLGVDGVSNFNALHSRKYDDEAHFCAFDVLAEGGEPYMSPEYAMTCSAQGAHGAHGEGG